MSKHFHTLPKFSFPCPRISPPPPPHFYRPTPNHSTLSGSECPNYPIIHTIHAPNVQTTSICHISHTLNTRKTAQIHTALYVLQRHSTHPSYHYTTLQMLSLDYMQFSAFITHVHMSMSTPRYLSAHKTTSQCSLFNAFSESIKAIHRSFFFVSYFSCS